MLSYLKHWNLSSPLTGQRDDGGIFLPAEREQSLTRLLQILTHDNVLITIPAAAGMGKSTLLGWLKSHLPFPEHEVFSGVLIREETTAGWLSKRLVQHLRGEQASASSAEEVKDALREALQLMDEFKLQQTRLVILIDNAERIKGDAYSELLGFFDLADTAGVPFSCVLAGDPAMGQQLNQHPALARRIRLQMELPPYTNEEAVGYIKWHLDRAGLQQNLISREVMLQMAKAAYGLPSRMHNLLENTLLEAAQAKEKIITLEHVSAADRLLAPIGEPRGKPTAPVALPPETATAPTRAQTGEAMESRPQSAPANDSGSGKKGRISIGSLLKDV